MAAWPAFPDPLDTAWNWPQQLHAQGTADLFYLMRASNPARREWAVTTSTCEVIGHLGIRDIQVRASARLGIGLGYPYVGQGFGVEALRGFLDVYFGMLGFVKLELDVTEYNFRARRAYDRLGFRTVGRSWRPVGKVSDFAFLDTPAYAKLHGLFKVDGDLMLARSIDMLLTVGEWDQSHGETATSS